ncbi:hypothetical protein QVD17_15519 [Tagetes erecta]|uniref:Uncharacterized protein n=1 Tax=Tagetes erecta TaxID=13708 RepID=A0AAD8KPC8_TARER|nr:hypothetical protein QVD17_15519 [Tagetes erecta]
MCSGYLRTGWDAAAILRKRVLFTRPVRALVKQDKAMDRRRSKVYQSPALVMWKNFLKTVRSGTSPKALQESDGMEMDIQREIASEEIKKEKKGLGQELFRYLHMQTWWNLDSSQMMRLRNNCRSGL